MVLRPKGVGEGGEDGGGQGLEDDAWGYSKGNSLSGSLAMGAKEGRRGK